MSPAGAGVDARAVVSIARARNRFIRIAPRDRSGGPNPQWKTSGKEFELLPVTSPDSERPQIYPRFSVFTKMSGRIQLSHGIPRQLPPQRRHLVDAVKQSQLVFLQFSPTCETSLSQAGRFAVQRIAIPRTVFLAQLVLMGGSEDSQPAIPATTADFATNIDTVGTADVLRIDFRVRDDESEVRFGLDEQDIGGLKF